ncbi:hypothetical protein DUNSADRAFT_17733 [Dunaliella salina]|uniref:Uncharacterized protein n=1 Tax=Dunaliella salina TaxID=3046 RepID=A0ABQ7GZU5_DUNSA|nr:hypothetical protein DUNSADRAFT_17733 [Dunaliella salina]|eukprot:KAF5840132.1 hypothetical protein DUNSADRAFT_17733 [Dunaliella salina]
MRRKPLGDISNCYTPPSPACVPGLLLSPRDDAAVPVKLTPASKGRDDLPSAWQQLTPRTPHHQSESFLSEDVQLTPPECKAMLSAINSAVDATEVKPGANEMPNSLEGWLQQVGITDTVSGTLKEQLQILYDRACESARLRSFMEAMKINELEMAAHEADDSARQMDLLADENTFLYEAKSSLMNDNELLRRQLQEAQARLESRVELQLQAQQQQQQQQQGQLHLLLEPSSRQAQQQQQQREQQQQQGHPASGQGRAMVPPMPPTPALIHTPAMTQASTLSGTPAWVTTRQGPLAPSPGLSALSIRTPSLDETEVWMQLDASFAAQRALTPLETPTLQDALAWVDGPSAYSARPRAHQAFGSPQSAFCPTANSTDNPTANHKDTPSANIKGSCIANNNGSPAADTNHSSTTSTKDSPAAFGEHSPAANSKGSPAASSKSSPAGDSEDTPACQSAGQGAPGTGIVQPLDQLTLRQACPATPSSNQQSVDPLTPACAATSSSVAAPATAGAAAAAREQRHAACPTGALAPDLGAVHVPAEQTGSSSTDAASAACLPAALAESCSTDAASAAHLPAALVESGSAVMPARSARQPQLATAEEPGVGVSLHQPRPTAAEEPSVGVSLLASDQGTVHLCVTPLARALKHGQPHGPTPDAQRLDVSSVHAGSQLSMVSRQSPSPVMWADWAAAAAAAGAAPDAISRAGSQMGTASCRPPEQQFFEDIAAAAGPGTNTDGTPAASIACPPAHQSPTRVTRSNTTTSAMAGYATTPDMARDAIAPAMADMTSNTTTPAMAGNATTPAMAGDAAMASIATTPAMTNNTTTPAMVGKATSPAPWAAPGPTAHGSEISFGSCGAAGFASESMGATASRLQRSSPGLAGAKAGSEAQGAGGNTSTAGAEAGAAGAEAMQGAGGSKSAASHSPPAAAASGPQAGAANATPRASDQKNSAHQSEANVQPEGILPTAQISMQDAVHSTPCVSAQFATPIERGSVAFQTPYSGGASFQTGASAFASATRSVTSKPPANAWDGNRFDVASALSFSTPPAQPCEPATSAAATHDSSNTHRPIQPHGEPSPPSSSAPLPAPPPLPFAAAFFNAFSAAFESAPAPAPPPCAPAHGADAAAPLRVPAVGGLQLNVAQASPPAEAALSPFPPNLAPAGSVGEAVGRVGNSAWALLCSDDEEEVEEEEEEEEEEGNGVSEAVVDVEGARTEEVQEEREEGNGVSEAKAVAAAARDGEAETTLRATVSSPCKMEAGSALHVTACGPEEQSAGTALLAIELESQIQVPAQPTPTHQQDAAAAQGCTPGTSQDHTPDAAAWGILRYQTPDPRATQAGERTTPPCQATTYPLKPLACPWGPQQGYQSASPTLQHHADHLRSENSTSSGGSTRYKPLCLNWCSAPSSQSRGVPGATVRAHSAASTPSTRGVNTLGVHDLCSDAESGQPKVFSKLDTSTPAPATKEQAAMQPQQAVLAGDIQQGVCSAGPAPPATTSETAAGVADADQASPGYMRQGMCSAGPAPPANMSETAAAVADADQASPQQTAAAVADADQASPQQTAAAVADADQASPQQTAAAVADVDQGLPEHVGTMYLALAPDMNTAAGGDREAAAQHSPARSDQLQLRAAASMVAPSEKLSTVASTALPMQHNDGEADTRTATSNEWDNQAPSTLRSPEAAGVPEEGEAIPDAGVLPSRSQQEKRSSRWGRRVTKEQEKEIRRRAAALKIHISPYFKGSRSRRTAARVCDGPACDSQDVERSASNLFQS